MWQKLFKNGINGKMLDCIKALYTNTYTTVRVNDELTNPITIDRGVKQGCTLNYLNQVAKGISFGDCKIIRGESRGGLEGLQHPLLILKQ